MQCGLVGLFAFLLWLAAAIAPASGQTARPEVPLASDCVGNNHFIYRAGSQLVSLTPFVPAGRAAEFILKERFDPAATYYFKIEAQYAQPRPFGGRDDISVTEFKDNDPLVTSGAATKGDSLVRIQVPAAAGSSWRTARLHVYSCNGADAPVINSRLTIRISSNSYSVATVGIVTALMYIGAAFAFRRKLNPAGPFDLRFLNPVVLTAGSDGHGSLSKLQILFFSLIVFALLFYVFLRTGQLSNLSETILMLLGIAAAGSVIGKATANKQERFSPENWGWLVSRGWVQLGPGAASRLARWRDLVTSDDEFDVYRYQSCIFSLLVGGALLFVGVYQLASFDIPPAVLGLLGLSQVVYVTGKLVTPAPIGNVDRALTELRTLEQGLRVESTRLGVAAADLGQSPIAPLLARYREQAEATAAMFASATSLAKPQRLEPKLA
jgi:hypothetical protein